MSPSVVVLHGYAVRVDVERGQLRVRDGFGAQSREQLLGRATCGLRRLIVFGHSGSMTFEAIRWLHDLGAGYLQLDRDGVVLAAFGPVGADRPKLRRAQAQSLDTPLGLAVARALIEHKLEAQLQTLELLESDQVASADAADLIKTSLAALPGARDRADIRQLEAQAAAAYWGVWRSLAVHFARRDLARIPTHWTSFGSRTSRLTGGPRLAANPANAILNYLYALLEAEASMTARVVGLDPGLGVLHADQLNRDSLAADLMEPTRPQVDRYLARLLATRSFAAADFVETRQGVCRIMPTLARELAQTAPHWGRLAGVVAEDVAAQLEGGAAGRAVMPTPISGRNRSAGRGPYARPRTFVAPTPSPRCTVCGAGTPRERDTCGPECEAAARSDSVISFATAGTQALARYRAAGGQPLLNEDARKRIGRRSSGLTAAAREWQRTHSWPADLEAFGREILPALANVLPAELASATGLSIAYCRQVKRGRATPHPMWWQAMSEIAHEG
jgi:CRISPR-associated endonuclease Cas1